ncbi:hypothetical protein D9757_010807 [Collybiopsis confluens]|uniref:G domain-containing protein n=1 Tax=Collybiopsis confluens TaxID=2823264 RepID=A0A8H5GUD3_9AGAR|nr:hypothetical protein D9757_010807 [Collybiopsis confluens]
MSAVNRPQIPNYQRQQQQNDEATDSGNNRSLVTQPQNKVEEDTTERTVLLFGASGSGKSSIINMLLSKPQALVSNSAVNPAPFTAEKYRIRINDSLFSIFDLAGLSEGGLFSLSDAQRTLQVLLDNLSDQGRRLHLLILCIRAPRITDVAANNYRLFYQTICRRQVPVVVVVTGLENHGSTMEDWWVQNQDIFGSYRMAFHDHACITTIRGRRLPNGSGFVYEQEYTDSVELVRKLIHQRATPYERGCIVDPRHSGSLWSDITSQLSKHLSSTIANKIRGAGGVGSRRPTVQRASPSKTQSRFGQAAKTLTALVQRSISKQGKTTKALALTATAAEDRKEMYSPFDLTSPLGTGVHLIVYGLPRDSTDSAITSLRSQLKDMYNEPAVDSFYILPGNTEKPVDYAYLGLKPELLFSLPRPTKLLETIRHDLDARNDCGPVHWRAAAGADKSRRVTFSLEGAGTTARGVEQKIMEHFKRMQVNCLASSRDGTEANIHLHFDLASVQDFRKVLSSRFSINGQILTPTAPRLVRPIYGLEVAVVGCSGLKNPRRHLNIHFRRKYGRGAVRKSRMVMDGHICCFVFKDINTTINALQDPFPYSELDCGPPVFLYILNSYGIPFKTNFMRFSPDSPRQDDLKLEEPSIAPAFRQDQKEVIDALKAIVTESRDPLAAEPKLSDRRSRYDSTGAWILPE